MLNLREQDYKYRAPVSHPSPASIFLKLKVNKLTLIIIVVIAKHLHI